MTPYIAFIRAINVPDHPKVPMDELRRIFSEAGCQDVSTYGHAGNVLFGLERQQATPSMDRMNNALRERLGDEALIVFRSLRQMQGIVNHAPFDRHSTNSEIKCYVAFLYHPPKSLPALPIESGKERLTLIATRGHNAYVMSRKKTNGFYGFPNNFAEEALGVMATTRNWSTVKKLTQRLRDRKC